MSILNGLARSLDHFLTQMVRPTTSQGGGGPDSIYETFAGVFNAKVYTFNGCTGALVAFFALGFFGIISPRKALLLGGCSLLGRQVAYESFKVLPKQATDFLPQELKKAGRVVVNALPKWLQNSISNADMKILTPEPSHHLGGVVIFYDTIPSNLPKVADNTAGETEKFVDGLFKAFKG